MSRFQKIFLASALVAVGFGVATFLGQPVLPTQLLSSRNVAPTAPAAVQLAPGSRGTAQATGRVRLLPDSPEMHAGVPAFAPDSATPQVPRLGGALAPVTATIENAEPRAFGPAPISSAPIAGASLPHARLRDEAPRPVGIDPQSPAAIRRLPTDNPEAADPYKVGGPMQASSVWSAPQLLTTGYNESAPASAVAVPTSYIAPMGSSADNQAGPPPWQTPDEPAESRLHVVVDGDSLERIASHYLSDPQRGREIYELNRAVLSSPDMLPIGAELKIPDRAVSASWDRRPFQSRPASSASNRSVGQAVVAPIQPVSASQGIIPRAQLAPPLTVQ